MGLISYAMASGCRESDSPVSPSPLSLEGIKSLKTLGTVTIGDFVFEIKEPKLFYSGEMYYQHKTEYGTEYDYGRWRNPWHFSVVVNQSVATVGITSNTFDYHEWKNHSVGDEHLVHFSDFLLSSVTVSKSYFYIPSMVIDSQCSVTSYYIGEEPIRTGGTVREGIRFEYQNPIFTNLSDNDYFTFVKSCVKAAQDNTPVINIF